MCSNALFIASSTGWLRLNVRRVNIMKVAVHAASFRLDPRSLNSSWLKGAGRLSVAGWIKARPPAHRDPQWDSRLEEQSFLLWCSHVAILMPISCYNMIQRTSKPVKGWPGCMDLFSITILCLPVVEQTHHIFISNIDVVNVLCVASTDRPRWVFRDIGSKERGRLSCADCKALWGKHLCVLIVFDLIGQVSSQHTRTHTRTRTTSSPKRLPPRAFLQRLTALTTAPRHTQCKRIIFSKIPLPFQCISSKMGGRSEVWGVISE